MGWEQLDWENVAETTPKVLLFKLVLLLLVLVHLFYYLKCQVEFRYGKERVITKIVLVGWRKRDIIGKSGNHSESVASGGLAWRIIVKGI